ncbi:biotin--[acetyl-CoA-carboxylase] ligase [Thioclava sp. SK-1]|uniref:biotin--[acetyl-CoA-carboxylase] ligase n=1 Tax=Thioclava sp. SK-1 TaxID=1889770 RepID=UPI00114D0826|nr:biotin--[acetyl-CoA-carboxylase] ligase [Thioclava sp. SK-1]
MDREWPEGVARHALLKVDSTMAEAARLAPQLAGPAWVLAHEQTAARGRRGRVWRHPKGNFSATYVCRPKGDASHRALYSFVAALALDAALAAVSGPHARLGIKWPNDVLLNGGKVAGILLESLGDAGLAIGIGVNLMQAPGREDVEPGAVAPVSLHSECGLTVTPLEFLDALGPAFHHFSQQFALYGFDPIRAAWLSRAARLGEIVTARTGTESYTGIFDTIDLRGAMILKQPDGPRAISAADVFF